MKTEELTSLGMSAEQAQKILAINGKDIEKYKAAAETTQAKVAELTGQIDQRDLAISELKKADAAGLQGKLEDLQARYDTDKQTWELKEAQRTYTDRRAAFFSGAAFCDDYAKSGVMAEFDKRNFQFSETDNAFVGAGEWLERLKAASPTTFQSNAKPPVVVRPTGGGAPPELTKESLGKMSYRERAALKREKPELYKGVMING